jgi:hypothetical protein
MAIVVGTTVGAAVIVAGAVLTAAARAHKKQAAGQAAAMRTKIAGFDDDPSSPRQSRKTSSRRISALESGRVSSLTVGKNSNRVAALMGVLTSAEADAAAEASGRKDAGTSLHIAKGSGARGEALTSMLAASEDSRSDASARSGAAGGPPAKKGSRLEQLNPLANRAEQLLAVAGDAHEEDAERGGATAVWGRINSGRKSITALATPAAVLGALLGTDLAPPEPQAAVEPAEEHAVAGLDVPRRTPRNSAWRAPPQLSGSGEDDDSAATPRTNVPRSGSMRVRRNSQAPGSQL